MQQAVCMCVMMIPKGTIPKEMIRAICSWVFSRSELQGIKAYAAQHRPDIPHVNVFTRFNPCST